MKYQSFVLTALLVSPLFLSASAIAAGYKCEVEVLNAFNPDNSNIVIEKGVYVGEINGTPLGFSKESMALMRALENCRERNLGNISDPKIKKTLEGPIHNRCSEAFRYARRSCRDTH